MRLNARYRWLHMLRAQTECQTKRVPPTLAFITLTSEAPDELVAERAKSRLTEETGVELVRIHDVDLASLEGTLAPGGEGALHKLGLGSRRGCRGKWNG